MEWLFGDCCWVFVFHNQKTPTSRIRKYSCSDHAFTVKLIIGEIDRFLAQSYGFTDEEFDFIINHDINYRMGLDDRKGDE